MSREHQPETCPYPVRVARPCRLPRQPVLGADVQRHGESYVVYLPPTLPFNDVVGRVQTEILARNWDAVGVQDVGPGLRKLGVWTGNKIIRACQSQSLKQAVRKDPFITLIIPCRFTVFREHVLATDSGVEFQRPREAPLVARSVLGIHRP